MISKTSPRAIFDAGSDTQINEYPGEEVFSCVADNPPQVYTFSCVPPLMLRRVVKWHALEG
jgi:hypothetical protein